MTDSSSPSIQTVRSPLMAVFVLCPNLMTISTASSPCSSEKASFVQEGIRRVPKATARMPIAEGNDRISFFIFNMLNIMMDICRQSCLLKNNALELVDIGLADFDRIDKIVLNLFLEGSAVLASQESDALTEIIIRRTSVTVP